MLFVYFLMCKQKAVNFVFVGISFYYALVVCDGSWKASRDIINNCNIYYSIFDKYLGFQGILVMHHFLRITKLQKSSKTEVVSGGYQTFLFISPKLLLVAAQMF